MKKVLVFGSTGSIGKNSLDVIRQSQGKFNVVGLCVNRDIKNLQRQIKEFSPAYVCVVDQRCADKLEKNLDNKIRLFKGEKGLQKFSTIKTDISVMGISGISCLRPLLINLQYSKRIALANKETIVVAGLFVFKLAKKFGTEIIPVDSEINALFQLFNNIKRDFSKVYITASGGALIDYKKQDLKKIGIKEVLSHPNWRMGRRITVDCATLVNKAFEVIEVHRFFGVPYKEIGVTVHRESVFHALVEFKDSTVFSCCYPPDMKIPIAYALHYPRRAPSVRGGSFDKKFSLSFEPVNYNRYPLFKMVLDAAGKDDNSLIILNACDETVVDYFLAGKIKFTDIYKVMNYIFSNYPSKRLRRIEDIFYWDQWARTKTKEYLLNSGFRVKGQGSRKKNIFTKNQKSGIKL
ncbi:MAG: 1-deoxy-D-xylulose-5-phosphate reductoisomerase [Candidatus Omnitrophota bacterium]|nr:1-deoxy-D-xylulose-5-phosphate reductoisomerase [Candidatus Omnitrophota bacterium]